LAEADHTMMPMTRPEIEVLLDTPNQHDYVVSAYADLTVQNGFQRHVELHLKNQARAAGETLAEAKARRDLDANIEVIRQAASQGSDPKARGLAVFSCVARGFRQVLSLDFPVENRLIIDEEPFVLPLLEHWYVNPSYLIALADSDEAHLFEARHGHPGRLADVVREDAHEEIQRDKPKFTFKKRFSHTWNERLFGAEDDRFVKDVAETVRSHWLGHDYAGLILLGQPPITAALRHHLPRELASSVIAEAPHAMTAEPFELTAHVTPLIERCGSEREERLLAEVRERSNRKHLVAIGPTDVLDALQQGRVTQIVLGPRTDIAGARCKNCNYRLGAPVRTCPYCEGPTRSVNAVQDLLVMAMRHRVPVQIVGRVQEKESPLGAIGDVVALLRAEANWAPDRATAEASEGHSSEHSAT
jgi:peptide subunit release factor 1 (eRF1)